MQVDSQPDDVISWKLYGNLGLTPRSLLSLKAVFEKKRTDQEAVQRKAERREREEIEDAILLAGRQARAEEQEEARQRRSTLLRVELQRRHEEEEAMVVQKIKDDWAWEARYKEKLNEERREKQQDRAYAEAQERANRHLHDERVRKIRHLERVRRIHSRQSRRAAWAAEDRHKEEQTAEIRGKMAKQALLAGQIGASAAYTSTATGNAAGSSDWVSKSSNFSQSKGRMYKGRMLGEPVPYSPPPVPCGAFPSDRCAAFLTGDPVWRERSNLPLPDFLEAMTSHLTPTLTLTLSSLTLTLIGLP